MMPAGVAVGASRNDVAGRVSPAIALRLQVLSRAPQRIEGSIRDAKPMGKTRFLLFVLPHREAAVETAAALAVEGLKTK